MRIGIMLRTFDEKGGVSVYSQNIVAELLRLQSEHHFVLYFRTEAHRQRFSAFPNVTVRIIPAKSKLIWDQLLIPRACRKDKLDLLFHPKFTAPFMAPCPVVMVVHGADWFMPQQSIYYPWWDVRYIRTVMPAYFRKCAAVISVSQLTTDNFESVLRLPAGKLQTIYFGPANHFKRVTDAQTLANVRQKYNLPKDYILTLTKLSGDKRKNFGQLLAGYRLYAEGENRPVALVVGGKDCDQLRQRYAIPSDGYGSYLHFPGWIDQQDLPAVYSMATAYLYPSNLEAFPIPLTEAMHCGTPIITSDANGLREIAGDAALFVDPTQPATIGAAIGQLIADPALQQTLAAKGQKRGAIFNWPRCARETLALFESLIAASTLTEAEHTS